MTPNPNRGKTFIRYAKAMALAAGNPLDAQAYAQGQRWHDVDDIVRSIQMAAVTPLGTSDMALPTPAGYDLAEFIRPMTILGKLTGLRRVPSRLRMITATSGATAYWKGEANVRPISKLAFQGVTLDQLNVIAMLTTTKELLKSSAPSAESTLARDLAGACVSEMDAAFIGYQNAGTANVKPAGISNGVTPIHSAGSSLANIDSDLGLLIQALTDAGSNLEFATFVLLPRTALYLARLRGSGGNPAFPGMTAKGGTLLGLPAITSRAVPTDVGSPQTSNTAITLLDPSEILVSDDGGSAVEISMDTAMQLSDSPGSGAQAVVSLWQNEAAALKIVRYANWRRCRDGVAQVLDNVSY